MDGLVFTCQFKGVPPNTFAVTEFQLTEHLSELFTLSLTAVSALPSLPFDDMLGFACSLTVTRNGKSIRTVRGLLASAEQQNTDGNRTWYHFIIHPENWIMSLGQNSRIFRQMSVPDLLQQLLILSHTPDYDMVNAYNLGLMALLVYKDEVMIDPDTEENMREFINTPNTTTAFFYQQCFDLSTAPVMTDGYDYPAIVTDVPFNQRYRPAIYLDIQQVDNAPKFEHDTQMFFVENDTQIIAAWRGTAGARDALTDATYRPIPCPKGILSAENAKVHKGFLEAYQCVGEYFPAKTTDIKEKSDSKIKKLYICGHSLGGALALLHASELRNNNPLLYTYGSPRVFTGSGVNALTSVTHFRHVNDADTVTSVPFDTNMDNWLFNLYGPLGTVFGFSWTLATLPTIPLQKALPNMGEVYYHHGNTVSFFEARQIGEDPKYPVGNGAGTAHIRWRMNGSYKFYVVPNIAPKLNNHLKQNQKNYTDEIKVDPSLIDDIFPKGNNPTLDTIMTMATDHSMASKYQVVMNNRLLSVLEPTKTPQLTASKQRFEALFHHKDASPLNAKRNTTFMALEDVLKQDSMQSIEKNEVLKQSLTRYKDETHEI